jgi:hypothetical protein
MFPDGWIAVARFNPYRVDWCPPAQICRTGPVISARPAFSDSEKRVFRHTTYSAQTPVLATGEVRFGEDWPPTIPPFVQRQSRAAPEQILYPMPDGRLLIERFPTVNRPATTYDVVDRRGVLAGTISLPHNQRVVGFGARSIYIGTIDADDVERIQRHPWGEAMAGQVL